MTLRVMSANAAAAMIPPVMSVRKTAVPTAKQTAARIVEKIVRQIVVQTGAKIARPATSSRSGRAGAGSGGVKGHRSPFAGLRQQNLLPE
jgi:hypothetical protein